MIKKLSVMNRGALQSRYKTVGRGLDPVFVAIESVSHLIGLLHDSRRRRDGIHQSMLTKLRETKRRLEANDLASANK